MAKTLNCIAIDDESLYLGLLELFIKQTPFLRLQGTFDNAVNALEVIGEGKIDLVITDVRMPQLTGTQFANIVNKKCGVILVSSSEEYALTGFEVNAIDFLLKPFTYDRFLQAVVKAQNQLTLLDLKKELENGNGHYPIMEKDSLFVKSSGKIVKLILSEILFVEARKEYVMIVTEKDDKVLTLAGISLIEDTLTAFGFFRIHKSFVVALNKIDEIGSSSIKIGKYEIPISLSHKQELIQEIQKRGIHLNLIAKK